MESPLVSFAAASGSPLWGSYLYNVDSAVIKDIKCSYFSMLKDSIFAVELATVWQKSVKIYPYYHFENFA
jgi:hypothetical protein